jgi:hypothetical protein
VHIDLNKEEKKILPPTSDNLRKLETKKKMMNNHMQGSIMDSIFLDIGQKKN